MDELVLEVASILDTLYESIYITNCFVLLNHQQQVEQLENILQSKLYPIAKDMSNAKGVWVVSDTECNDDYINIALKKSNVVVASKSYICKNGFDLLQGMLMTENEHINNTKVFIVTSVS